MLPAPSTTATSTPFSRTACTWRATAWTRSRSVPYSRSPINASPDSLSRMRLKPTTAVLRADREAGEAPDDHVLPELSGQLGTDLVDRLAVVAVGVDVRLAEQGDLLEPLAQLALGDLAAYLLGL